MDIKYISEAERQAIPSDSFAGPNKTFPIDSQAHVFAAAHLYGQAADPERVKANVIRLARRKGYALPEGWDKESQRAGDDSAEEGKTMIDDTLISFGSPVKRLDSRKIGGHLVLFSTQQDPDTSADYFDAKTDFDLEDGDRRTGYYNHGMDVKVGNLKIGWGTLKKDDVGLWLEAQLKDRDEYVDAILDMVDDGKLGLSSGALSHLVRRDAKNRFVSHITHWPVGEWSLTPTPAEPRTIALPLKTWMKSLQMDAGLSGGGRWDPVTDKFTQTAQDTQREMAMGSLSRLSDTLHRAVGAALDNCSAAGHLAAKSLPMGVCADCMSAMGGHLDEHARVGKALMGSMMGHPDSPPDETKSLSLDESAALTQVKAAFSITTVRQFEEFLREAGYSRKQATALALHGYNSLRDAGETEPTPDAPVIATAAPVIDPLTQQDRDRREQHFKLLSRKLDGLLLEAG